MRALVLAITVVWVGFFAVVFLSAVANGGTNIAGDVLTLLVLALLGFGIVGALRGPPDP